MIKNNKPNDLSKPHYAFAGTHFIANYEQCDLDALINLDELKINMIKSVVASGATVLTIASHVFEPNGITMAIVLSESHATIHTYPEVQSCFVDLFTCGDRCSYELFDQTLRKYLKPQLTKTHIINRGTKE